MKNKMMVILIFSILFILIVTQLHFVWMYFDDYGYAALSYLGTHSWKIGPGAGLGDIISFLAYHYSHWGGRVLWFFLEIILLRINISAYRIVQAIFTLSIFYLIYKIVSKEAKNDSWRLALATLACFLLVDLMVIRDSYYWFTASVLYLLPMLPVLLVVYLTMNKSRTLPINVLCIVLAFISAWSQEQVSVLIVAYLGLMTLHKYIIEKDRNKWDIIITISSLIGFGVLMLSPGSKERMIGDRAFYNLDLVHKIIKNIPTIISSNFHNDTSLFGLIFFSTSTYYIIKNRKLIKSKLISNLIIINSLIIIAVTITKNEAYFNYLLNINNNHLLMIIIAMIQLGILLITMGYLLYKEKKYTLVYVLISGILSQVAMLMAPYFTMRSATMFEITYYIIAIYIFNIFLKSNKINFSVVLVPFLIIGIFNYYTITKGYYNNYQIKINNEEKLKRASKDIKHGKDIKEIILDDYNPFYGTYESDSVGGMMKSYYDIPDNIIVRYNRE